MMDVLIFYNFRLWDICSQYVSLKFSRYFRGIGSFELILNSEKEAEKFDLSDFVMLGQDTYIIEYKHKYVKADKSIAIEIRGRHICSILEQRIAIKQDYTPTISYEKTSEALVRENFIEAIDTDRNIENMIIKESDIDTYPTTTYSLEKMSVASMLNKSLANKELGYTLKYDIEAKNFVFSVLEPQYKNYEIVFSREMGNVSECDIYDDISNYKNVCFVFNKDTVEQIGNEKGLYRKEMFVESQYNQELSNTKRIESASVEVLSTPSFTYKVDYDVGTIVSFYDKELGIEMYKQINCITEYHSEVDEIEITIGDFVPTIFDKVKRKE